MKTLQDQVKLGGLTLKNRLCVPPMVVFNLSEPDGFVSEGNIAHYRSLAEGGFGLIIQEATCVSPDGLLHDSQLGLWKDEQIPGHQKIVEAVHAAGSKILVQIHHAGLVSSGQRHLCPSPYVLGETKGEEMSLLDIQQVKTDFANAAYRAKQAGYDGVEIHGCHGYLLSQFMNNRVNRRQDHYGDPMALTLEIFHLIRSLCGHDFLVGVRLGGFEPDLTAAIDHAKALEQAGADFLDISYGFSAEMDTDAPGDPQLKDIIRAAGAIKAQVSCPVFAVNGICTPEEAKNVLNKTNVDMIDIGRSALVDTSWAKKALAGEMPGKCLHCKSCQWRFDFRKCPGRIMMEKEK